MARSFSGWSVARLGQYIRDTIRNKIYFKEQTTAPDIRSGVEEAVIYAKDDSGTTKLYYKDSAGTEYEIGGGGIAWDGSTANGVATFKNEDEATAQPNLTFDADAAAADGYLDIKNTVDDGTTNRVMLRLHNYRSDDADVNDFGPVSIDFDIENVSGGAKTGTARIAAVSAPVGTDHTVPAGEKSSALIFSTMNDETLSEAVRIDNLGKLTVAGDLQVDGGVTKAIHTFALYASISATPAAGYYMPWVYYTESQTIAAGSLSTMRCTMIAPYDGKFISVSVLSNGSGTEPGSTIIGVHKNNDTTAMETQTVNMVAFSTTYTGTFTSNSFSKGDALHLNLNATNSLDYVTATVVIEYDEST